MNGRRQILNPIMWVTLYSNGHYSFAFFRIGDKEVAKNLVQVTFLSAIKSKDNFKGEISEKSGLSTILKIK